MYVMGIHLLIVASMSLCPGPLTQGIMQHPTAVKIPATVIREVRTDVIIPFHFPNYPSNQSATVYLPVCLPMS